MPPKYKFTREQIRDTALELVRTAGIDALTARALGEKLGASTKVIFGLFENMEALRTAVLDAAYERYTCYLAEEAAQGKYPPYKASGMAYIRFARQERELFKLLFMQDRSGKDQSPTAEFEDILGMITESVGLSREEAQLFHLEMWSSVHGVAVMVATSYLTMEEDLISRMVTDVYQGLRLRYQKEGTV